MKRTKRARKLSMQAALDRLKEPQLCEDSRHFVVEATVLREQAPPPEEWERRMAELIQPFVARWGVLPPQTGELLDPDPRRRVVEAITSGRWGLVPVFPWTKNHEIRERVTKIQGVVPKQHKDALRFHDEQLRQWLAGCGFKRPAIVRAVSGQRKGLRRLTKAEAFSDKSEKREQELWKRYQDRGITEWSKIQQLVSRRLRGSEAPASAVVRMSEQRYVKRLERLNEDLATPIQSEPLSHALTMLFRTLPVEDDATVTRHAIAVREAFLATVVPSPAPAESLDAPVQHEPLEVIVSGRWGVVPVFPWTTGSDIQASVKALRARAVMPPHPQDGPGPARATRPAPFEPLSDALVSLFRSVAAQDQPAIRQCALGARAAFSRVGTS
jgi:hypothetical protein